MRGEEVASAIDTHVRGAVEKMVEEISSSIEDIRTLVDQQLKAALQSVRADVNSLSVLPQIQKGITELEQTLAAGRPAGGGDSSKLKRAVVAIEKGKSQVDVLNSLLDQCLEFGSRAALLILRGETFSGWKGVGFSARGGSDEAVKRFNAAPGLVPELDGVLRQERIADWDGANLSTRLGASLSERAILVPMVIKDKVAAAVYVDALPGEGAKLDRAAVELLVFTTGLLVDTIAMRKKSPSPSLSEDDVVAVSVAPGPVAAPQPPRPVAPPPAPQPEPAAPPRPAATAPVAPPPAAAPRPAAPPPAAPAPASTVAIQADQIRAMMANAAAAAAQPKPAPPAPGAIGLGGGEDRPSTQFIPPAGLGNRQAGASPAGDEAKKHDEARRFARLLVSEIKLYNESKVEQGRKNRDIYERLKEDIDRSRQMYDDRIGEDIRKKSNYFYDELVRILADGKADQLGL